MNGAGLVLGLIDSWVDEFLGERLQTLSHAFGLTTTIVLVCFGAVVLLAIGLVVGAWLRLRARVNDYQRGVGTREVLHHHEIEQLLEQHWLKFRGTGRWPRRRGQPETAPLLCRPRPWRRWLGHCWFAAAVFVVVVAVSVGIYFVRRVCF